MLDLVGQFVASSITYVRHGTAEISTHSHSLTHWHAADTIAIEASAPTAHAVAGDAALFRLGVPRSECVLCARVALALPPALAIRSQALHGNL